MAASIILSSDTANLFHEDLKHFPKAWLRVLKLWENL